jgi:hypothetical protein
VNSPLPLTETVTAWPPQSAAINVEFFACVGSAPATGEMAAEAQTARTSASRFISPPLKVASWTGTRREGPQTFATPGRPRV